jgi:hypothetical protein
MGSSGDLTAALPMCLLGIFPRVLFLLCFGASARTLSFGSSGGGSGPGEDHSGLLGQRGHRLRDPRARSGSPGVTRCRKGFLRLLLDLLLNLRLLLDLLFDLDLPLRHELSGVGAKTSGAGTGADPVTNIAKDCTVSGYRPPRH